MRRLNGFIHVGITGLVLTALIHYGLPLLHAEAVFPGISGFLYPICIALIVIGLGIRLKVEKSSDNHSSEEQ